MNEYLIAHIGHTNRHHEHITWWKPESRGYTICIDKAGLYDEAEARSICRGGICIAVRKDHVQPLSRTTPYYRRSNGELSKLYDGGPHSVVPNSADAWRAIKALSMYCGKTERPTPIGSKARAIYLSKEIAA